MSFSKNAKSICMRTKKRIEAYIEEKRGNQEKADILLFEVAAERLSVAADKAIASARQGKLKEFVTEFELVSIIVNPFYWHGCVIVNEELLAQAVNPVIMRCRENNVILAISSHDNRFDGMDAFYPAKIEGRFLQVIPLKLVS